MNEYLLIAIRTVFSFLILLMLARILGKKQISQLTFFDYVVGIGIGDMASSMAIESSMKFIDPLIGLIIYTLLTLLITFGAIKSFKFRELVESSPSILIKDGKIMEKTLAKHKMTFNDLLNGLREKDAFNISEVELAMLETNGQISVMKKPEYQPLTPKDIGLKVEEDHAPSLVIVDGALIEKHLNYLGYTKEWLLQEIKKRGANKFEDVFLAQIDTSGNVYVDLFNDKNSEKQAKQKPNYAAKLRQVQVGIERLALQTKDQNVQRMYYNQSIELENIIKKLNPYLNEVGKTT
ncbi:DUF421 domain-containing protein [Niallia sp. XMNu-256]|uniref:DUF421 domain-containing protein n=1 Tax=Niallia sp. XMNu-256 TaxID=3082444 RepID=UPI0030D13C73